MHIRFQWLASLALAAAVSGCSSVIVKPQPPAKPVSVTAARFFAVVKQKGALGIGCKIVVAPDKQEARIKVQRDSMVAWVLGNDCDEADTLQLKFYVKGKGKTTEVSPIDFESFENGVLRGKVKNEGTGEIRYQYTVIVGDHQKDPEIIVF
jgi:hypothetical protein